MNSKKAIKALEAIGYFGRNGKGDHYIMTKDGRTIVIPMGKQQLSSGMVAKVRSFLNK